MTKQELELLGLTETDVLNKLVDRLCEQYMADGDDYRSDFESRIEEAVKAKVDEKLAAALESHILPKITEMVDGICLQETNKWGEVRGSKLTFVEYLVQRADAYIREEVNHNGKSKAESDSYGWSKSTTRIAYMIHEHLHYSIARAMEQALGTVNSTVRKGLEEAVKTALDSIKVKVDTKVQS